MPAPSWNLCSSRILWPPVFARLRGGGHMLSGLEEEAAECLRRAAEFKMKADKASLPSDRGLFRSQERQWLHLAQPYEVELNRARARLGQKPTQHQQQAESKTEA